MLRAVDDDDSGSGLYGDKIAECAAWRETGRAMVEPDIIPVDAFAMTWNALSGQDDEGLFPWVSTLALSR